LLGGPFAAVGFPFLKAATLAPIPPYWPLPTHSRARFGAGAAAGLAGAVEVGVEVEVEAGVEVGVGVEVDERFAGDVCAVVEVSDVDVWPPADVPVVVPADRCFAGPTMAPKTTIITTRAPTEAKTR